MFTKSTKKIDVYTNGEFTIEVDESGECYEAYIYRNGYGIKELMFGLPKEQQTKEEAIDIILANFEEYAADYDEEYKD